MKFLSDILAKAGLTVDGVVTFNNTATGQTPATNDNSTKLATTAFIKNQSYLTANQTITVSGDATGSGTTSIALTLANSGVTAGSYGNASNIPTITVDAKGRITSISTNAVSIITTLAGLSDVTLTSPTTNQVLQYNGTKWVNGAAPTSYTLPIASGVTLGGIKIGSGLNIDGTGIVSVAATGVGAIRALQQFTATAGQTVFTVSGGYTAGLIDVFLNGVLLTPTSITASNGNTFTLADAALVNDVLDVYVYNPIYNGFISNTDQVPEGATNLYYTNARARAAITLTTTGSSGAATYNSSTGVLNIPSYIGGVVSIFGRTGTVVAVSGDYTTTLVTEGTNLYYTDARARAAISVTGSGSYNSATGVITVTGGVTSVNTLTGAVTLTTTNIAEGTNLYYTDARVLSYLTANSYATQTYVGTQIANLVASAPSTLDTLNELAAALGNDPSFATTVATSIGTKVPQTRTITINGTAYDLSADRSWTIASGVTSFNTRTGAITPASGDYTTTLVTEGTNLYYTDARARLALSFVAGSGGYNSTTGVITIPTNNTQITNGANYITLVSLSSSATGLTYTNTTGVLSLTAGYSIPTTASQTTWDTAYTNRITSLTTTGTSGAATLSGNVLNIPQYQGGVTNFNTRTGAITLTSSDVTTALTYTPVTNARTLTINGTAYDLTADRTWTIGVTPSARAIQTYTTTAAQTTFTVTGGYVVGLVDVFINGVRLTSADFTATNGTTVVLTTGTSVNNIVDVIKYTSAFTASSALRQVTYFTATAGQTSFTVSYTPGLIDVFYNGSKLAASEYTASNGTTVVLANAAVVNDALEIISYAYSVGAFSGQTQLNGTGLVRMSGTTVSYDNATYATQSYVTTAVANLVNAAPSTLDTLNELAAALGNDANFATTITTSLAGKQSTLTFTGPLVNTSGTVSISQSSGSTNGFLSNTDWTIFNSKQSALTFSGPLVNTSGTISITQSSGSTNGYLSNTDWTTFNNKVSTASLANYLLLTGGTLTGPLLGTSASFSVDDLNTILVSNPTTTGATTGSGIGFKAYNGTSVTQSAGIILTSNTWSYGTYSANQLSIGSDGTGGIALRSANSAPISFFTGGSTAGLSTARLSIASTGTTTFSVPRTNGTNVTSIILSDSLTGISTPGYGLRIFGYSNGGGVQSAIGFENGGTGTNNESQISFYTQNVAGSLTRQLLISSTGASTFSSIIDGTIVRLSSTQPLSFTGGGNTGTFTQSAIYSSQNNVSGNTANGIFIERGRITDSSSAEVRYLVIGSRGGQIQWQVDGSGNTSQIGTLNATSGVFSSTLTATGAVRSINGGVDASYQDAFVGVYSGNNNEQNAIQTSVSSVAASSGFRFQVSNGGGSSVRTTMMTLTRSNLSVSNEIIIGAQGGTDTTYISGGSGYGSVIRNIYAGGSVNNELRGNGNNYFNVLLGSMGVGTNNPQYLLDVNGSGRFVGNIYANNTIYGSKIIGSNLVAGNISSNMPSAPAYILIVDLNNIAGFSLSGKVNAASYTCWNISDIWIQKNYSSTTASAGIEGKYKSGCDFSIVNINYGAGNYIALRFTSNPEIDVLWTGFRLADQVSGGAFQVITSGVTVNSTYATY